MLHNALLLQNDINNVYEGKVIVVQSVTLEDNEELCFAPKRAKTMWNGQFVQLSVQKLQKKFGCIEKTH